MWLCFDLVESGCINSEEAMRILNRQVSSRVPIGQLAVECEMMAMSQVNDVLAQQVHSALPFGELAIEMGYLSREQLGDLILRQLDSAKPFSELVVSEGLMTQEEFDKAIATSRHKRMGRPEERQFELLGL